jgi:hypothetical protein
MNLESKPTADAIRDDLAEAGRRFHELVDSMSDSDWKTPSRNPAWTNGQVVYHVLFGFILIPALFGMIRFWSRMPPRFSRSFARALNWSTPVFNLANSLGPKGQAALFGQKRAIPIFDRVHRAILRRVDSLEQGEWRRGMYYPDRWDNLFRDFMTYEDLFRYPGLHLKKHLNQLALGTGGSHKRTEPTA